MKGNLAIGVGASTPHTISEHGVSSITTADVHISATSSRLTPPADLNGQFRFAERRNLISVRAPSRFKRSLNFPPTNHIQHCVLIQHA